MILRRKKLNVSNRWPWCYRQLILPTLDTNTPTRPARANICRSVNGCSISWSLQCCMIELRCFEVQRSGPCIKTIIMQRPFMFGNNQTNIPVIVFGEHKLQLNCRWKMFIDSLFVQDEDLSQYSFSKFASTYFQGATHSHIKQNLRQPLLPMVSEADTMVSTTILCVVCKLQVVLWVCLLQKTPLESQLLFMYGNEYGVYLSCNPLNGWDVIGKSFRFFSKTWSVSKS